MFLRKINRQGQIIEYSSIAVTNRRSGIKALLQVLVCLMLASFVLILLSCAAPDARHLPTTDFKKLKSISGSVAITCEVQIICKVIEIDGIAFTGETVVTLSPGEHILMVAAKGYKATTFPVRVNGDETVTVPVKLEHLPAKIIFDSIPRGAKIIVEQENLTGITPHSHIFLTPGYYTIQFLKPGYYKKIVRRKFSAGENAEVKVKLMKKTGYVRIASTELLDKLVIDGVESSIHLENRIELTVGSHVVSAKSGCKTSDSVFNINFEIETEIRLNWQIYDLLEKKYACLPSGKFPLGADVYELMNPFRMKFIESFWISRHEVTVSEYQKCITDKKCTDINWNDCDETSASEFNHPVSCITSKDAERYAAWLTANNEGIIFRLPTAQEWERSVRGSWSGRYPENYEIYRSECNTCGKECEIDSKKSHTDSWPKSAPVGIAVLCQTKEGVFDLIGNMAEWVIESKQKDKTEYGFRGGSWYQPDNFLDPAYPTKLKSGVRKNYLGFRLVAVPELSF